MHNLVGDFLRRQAERIPEKDCQVFGQRRYTYRYLNTEANRLGNAFLTSGLSPGDHVGIFSSNCIEYLIAFWGAAKAGVVLVHFNARLKEDELSGLVEHADVKILLFHEDLLETVERARNRLGQGTGLRWVCIGSRPGSWAMDFSSYLKDSETQEPSELRSLAIREDDPLVMLYTSGTEGFPKGVLMSHRQRIGISMQQLLWFMGQRETTYRFLNAMPFFHMVAQTYVLTLALIKGTGFQVFPFEPDAFLKTIEQERITSLILVPTIIKRVLDHPLFPKTDLSTLEIVRYGGEPLDTGTRERLLKGFPGVRFSEGLGQTEMGTPIYQLEDDFITHPESAGRPDSFCDVRIIRENGEVARTGEVGEIVVRSPSLMLGYYKDPEATKAFFRYGPDWGCTGDMGYMDEEGFVTAVSRGKDMYISGGENVYPVEIENVLCRHPSVFEAAVLGVPDKNWGEVGAAAIVLKPGEHATEEGILEYGRRKLARFKCPRYIKFYKTLPKTPLGKVIKGNLLDDFKAIMEG